MAPENSIIRQGSQLKNKTSSPRSLPACIHTSTVSTVRRVNSTGLYPRTGASIYTRRRSIFSSTGYDSRRGILRASRSCSARPGDVYRRISKIHPMCVCARARYRCAYRFYMYGKIYRSAARNDV